ncbi:hypothetical protein D3C75_251160 [compost metagenome]
MHQHPVMFSHAWNRPYLPTGGAEKVYLLIETKGVKVDSSDRAQMNLSLVLDRSGSMSGRPLQFSKRACRQSGIGITVMGVGERFDEELMERMAEHGGGNFHFIEKPDEIPAIFQKELEGLLAVTAQNLSLTIEPADCASITGIYGYACEKQGNRYNFHAGELFAGEVKTVLLKLTLHPHTKGVHQLLRLTWEYVDVTDGASPCTVVSEVSAEFTNDINLLNLSEDAEVYKQIQLTESAKIIEDAMQVLDEGDVPLGKLMLKQQAERLMSAAIHMDDEVLRQESERLYSQLENFGFNSITRKQLHEQKYRQMKRKR